MGNCSKLGMFLQCSLSDICEAGCINTKNCMYGLCEKNIGMPAITDLKNDCNEIGLYVRGIEDIFRSLQKRNCNVDVYASDVGHLSKPWSKIVRKSIIKPLICSTKVSDGHIRPSEFGCYLARVFSKTDLDKAAEIFGLTLERRLAKIGTTRHELCLSQHMDKFEHAERAEMPSRDEYCEKPVSYVFESKVLKQELIVAGRPDCRFTFEDNHSVGVLDLKRSRHFYYVKNSHQRQTLCYSLGLAQQLGGFDCVYTMILEGPFAPQPFQYRYPQIHVTKADLNSGLVAQFHSDMEESFIEQAQLLDNLNYMKQTKEKKLADRRGCINQDTGYSCFDKPACDIITSHCIKTKRCLRDVIDDFKLKRKGYILPQL